MKLDFKKVEAILYKYNTLIAKRKTIKLMLEDETEDETGVGAIVYDKVKIAPTFNISKTTEEAGIRNIENKEKLKNAYFKNEKEIKLIELWLESLDEFSRRIIELRYFKGYQVTEICLELNASLSTIKRKKQNAIKYIVSNFNFS